jgi:hypothetical protein
LLCFETRPMASASSRRSPRISAAVQPVDTDESPSGFSPQSRCLTGFFLSYSHSLSLAHFVPSCTHVFCMFSLCLCLSPYQCPLLALSVDAATQEDFLVLSCNVHLSFLNVVCSISYTISISHV